MENGAFMGQWIVANSSSNFTTFLVRSWGDQPDIPV